MRLLNDELHLSATDLAAHLGCQHRTQLDRRAAHRTLEPPSWQDPLLEVLRARGDAHERDYIAHLKTTRSIEAVDLRGQPLDDTGLSATRDAMESGVGAIVQAPLVDGRFRGIADVLLRVPEESALGAWSYQVVDTKLASETRAGTVLQLCLYTRIVEKLQGRLPAEMLVVSPEHLAEPERFRTTDYLAYARHLERQLLGAVEGDLESDGAAPEPVSECDICRWWKRCHDQRRAEDHLSFVAGISRLQRRELEVLGIGTLTALADAELPLEPKPARGSPESYERVHHQARVQRASVGNTPVVEFLADVEAGKGLARLPTPSPGDVFLDLEGDPFVDGGGLEYLIGWVTVERDATEYVAHWALDRAAEKVAFETLIDALHARWLEHPDFCVYHFGAYEPATLKRLMGRHATREEELDQLLRGERFVDLHSVVRESLRIGIETYGLKQLEEVHGFERDLELRQASIQKHTFERALELGVVEDAPAESREGVERYNRDDCVSTWRLRNWLEDKRAQAIAAGADLPRPSLGEGLPSEDQEVRSQELQTLMDALTDGVPEDPTLRSAEEQARWILAYLLEWHRREAKASWWEFFRLADLPVEGLRAEKNGLVGLEHVERIPEGRIPIDRYRFPEQDHDVRPPRDLYVDAETRLGKLVDVDLAARSIDVKKTGKTLDLHPYALFAKEGVSSKPIPEALERIARWVAEHGIDAPGPYRAARDLLRRRRPRLTGEVAAGTDLARPGESTRESATRLAMALDESVLPIQGPPGTGKTYTGARVICELVRSGQKVGITGPSHKVIRNLLEEVVRAAEEEGVAVRCFQRVKSGTAGAGGRIQESHKSDSLGAALRDDSADVVAGTAWAWAREDVAGLVHTLVIDEAGQMSLANSVAAAQAARNVLLLGDPQQLEQPIQGSHPPGCDSSALEHLLGDHDTVRPDRGLLLGTTWRLHPKLCAFTSELFYEGLLGHHEHCARQAVTGDTPFAGAGLWLSLVEHAGNTSSAPEEVGRIAELVAALTAGDVGWVDFGGVAKPLSGADLRVVSPYNAQVSALTKRLPTDVQVGTVDRFQGQEAPVVIYSMTTSSTEEAPRGLEFLLSLNRLNVATSRARCACILVASPRLLEAECRTPRQIKLVNALCRYRELAQR